MCLNIPTAALQQGCSPRRETAALLSSLQGSLTWASPPTGQGSRAKRTTQDNPGEEDSVHGRSACMLGGW